MAADPDSLARLRAAGSVSNSLRDVAVYGERFHQSTFAAWYAGRKTNGTLVDRRDLLSILLRYLRRLLRRRQRNSDAGGDGPTRLERVASRKRHQEFSWHLHQQYCGAEFFAGGAGR